MNFQAALNALKDGQKIQRQRWKTPEAEDYLYLVPANKYPAQTAIAKKQFGEDALVPYKAYIAMKTAENDVAVWSPTTTDILADDWQIAKDAEASAQAAA